MSSYFITGTDTSVGKTLVSAALLLALGVVHPRVAGMKPVTAGLLNENGHWIGEDVRALRAASSCAVPPELDSPVLLHDAMSPHIAAARAGVRIDLDHLVASYRALAQRVDAVVVEGAGGFHVPLTDQWTGADLAQALGLPVILVVGLRLGCLSHAALTAEAIRARGLPLAGWVANRIDLTMPAQEENIAWLQQRLQAPLLADIPFQRTPDPRAISTALP